MKSQKAAAAAAAYLDRLKQIGHARSKLTPNKIAAMESTLSVDVMVTTDAFRSGFFFLSLDGARPLHPPPVGKRCAGARQKRPPPLLAHPGENWRFVQLELRSDLIASKGRQHYAVAEFYDWCPHFRTYL